MMTKRLSWYIHRLTKMPPAEVLYRLASRGREWQDKRRGSNFFLPDGYVTETDFSSLFSLSGPVDCCNLQRIPNTSCSSIVAAADGYFVNRYSIFGIEHNFGEKIDWHLDPKTGNHWPLKFWAEVDIRDGFTIGGPKFAWEVNRLYSLPILAMGFKFTDEQKYADKFFSLLKEWLVANPYPMGVNWTSGIELAIRVANLIWGLSFLENYRISGKQKKIMVKFIWLHGRHLYRFPSKYSSNNNHTIAEAFGLFLIGVFFPHFSEAKKWRAFGMKVLERECGRQILPDGGSYEYSTTYLSFVFDFYLLFRIVCEKYGIPYNSAINERLEHACEFIYTIMDRSGNVPNVGDQDSAILVNFGLDNHDNFKSILNTGAVLFNRPEFCRDDFPDFKTFILLGSEEVATLQQATDSPKKNLLMRESGLGVMRNTVAGKEILFVGNATPLGMPPLYAHGHLDALSFVLSIAGKEFLIDPGTYLYHCGGTWRRYFRSTAAHNTLRINKTDMAEQTGDFMFGKPYRITEHFLHMKDNKIVWQAGYNGCIQSQKSVKHVRNVVFDQQSGQFDIKDTVNLPGSCVIEQFFHFHPDCDVNIDAGKALVENNGVCLEMHFDTSVEVLLFNGSRKPLLGWYSEAFNHLTKTNTIVCRGQFEGAVDLTTIIVPVPCRHW